MNLPKYSRGFTIIELLVSMSIITIIAGGIIPTFTSYIRNQNLIQAQEQLLSDLRTVQNRALTGALSNERLPDSSGELVRYWGVTFPSDSGSSISVFVSTTDAICPPAASTFENQNQFTLPNDVLYFGAGGCAFFDIKNGDITGTLDPPIQLKIKESDAPLIVNFNSAGLIWTEE
jgi:prepilin-type N-terminal cleavage/methylation domain-containing protein